MYYCPKDRVKPDVECLSTTALAAPKKKVSYSEKVWQAVDLISSTNLNYHPKTKVTIRCPNKVHYMTLKEIVHPDMFVLDNEEPQIIQQHFPVCANMQDSE